MIKFKQYLVEQSTDKNSIWVGEDSNDKLMSAAVYGNLKFVKYLVGQGADIHYRNDKALRWASEHGHLGVVKYLISKGADIHAENDQALYLAVKYNRLEIIKYLISKGVDIHINNDIILILANEYDNLNIFKYLIKQGSNIPKSMNIPEDVQEMAIKNNPKNIFNIKNLRSDLKEKYKHLLTGSKFGFFSDD
jgi:ankyrin repeat protein